MLNHVLYLINIRVNIPTSYTFVLLSFAFMHLPAIHYPYLHCRDCNSCFVYYDGLVVLIIAFQCAILLCIDMSSHTTMLQPKFGILHVVYYLFSCMPNNTYHVNRFAIPGSLKL